MNANELDLMYKDVLVSEPGDFRTKEFTGYYRDLFALLKQSMEQKDKEGLHALLKSVLNYDQSDMGGFRQALLSHLSKTAARRLDHFETANGIPRVEAVVKKFDARERVNWDFNLHCDLYLDLEEAKKLRTLLSAFLDSPGFQEFCKASAEKIAEVQSRLDADFRESFKQASVMALWRQLWKVGPLQFPELVGNKPLVFTEESALINLYADWVELVHQKGILSLEDACEEIQSDLLREVGHLVVDGTPKSEIARYLEMALDRFMDRITILEKAAVSGLEGQVSGLKPALLESSLRLGDLDVLDSATSYSDSECLTDEFGTVLRDFELKDGRQGGYPETERFTEFAIDVVLCIRREGLTSLSNKLAGGNLSPIFSVLGRVLVELNNKPRDITDAVSLLFSYVRQEVRSRLSLLKDLTLILQQGYSVENIASYEAAAASIHAQASGLRKQLKKLSSEAAALGGLGSVLHVWENVVQRHILYLSGHMEKSFIRDFAFISGADSERSPLLEHLRQRSVC